MLSEEELEDLLSVVIEDTTIASERLRQYIKDLRTELSNLKEIEQQHKVDNGLLRQELDMQIEHNKEIDNMLYAKQSMIDELMLNEEKLKIELAKEKEKNKSLKKQIKEMQEYYKNADFIFKDKIKEKIEENIKEADDVLVNHNYLRNFNNEEQEHYYNGFKDASLFIEDLLEENNV